VIVGANVCEKLPEIRHVLRLVEKMRSYIWLSDALKAALSMTSHRGQRLVEFEIFSTFNDQLNDALSSLVTEQNVTHLILEKGIYSHADADPPALPCQSCT
jgi:hypothetical protein